MLVGLSSFYQLLHLLLLCFRKDYPVPGAEVHQDRQAGSGIGVTASQDSPEIVFIIHDGRASDQHCHRQ